jgi:predicted MFS family arabinose efflux permease
MESRRVGLMAGLSAGYLVGSTGPSVMPLWLARMPAEYHLSSTVVGYLASFEILLIALTTMLASVLLKVCRPRLLAVMAASTICVGNLLSLNPSLFFVVIGRGLSGIGMGGLLASVIAVAASQPRAQATLATMKLIAVAFLALFFYFVTATAHNGLCYVIFATIAGLAIVAGASQSLVPDAQLEVKADNLGSVGFQLRAVLMLLAIIVLFLGYGSIWSFVVRIGEGAHFTRVQIGAALSVSAVAGIAGPFIARVVSERYGLVRPIYIGGFVLAVVAMTLPLMRELVAYIICVGILAGIAPFLTPYILALVGSVALDVRYASAALGCVLLGIAGGPTIATGIAKVASFEFIGLAAAAFAFTGLAILAAIVKNGSKSMTKPSALAKLDAEVR